ncbi:glycosyltransferase family 4 protein [Pontibacter pamirensis]|uniref:glycosyltransferase family 4 protein n=1 Tax=Pontibacter pamirensis TaxID=2562824 RepID=UPI00138A1F92|nr:glycosyltransferase family 4 protein [Pontibacter pamirensis]
MKLIFSHPTGNANVRSAASGFMEANLLDAFHTAVASFPGSFLDRLGGFGPLSEIRRRRFDPALRTVTKMWPWHEVGRIAASRVGLTKLIEHERGVFCIDAVYQDLDRRVANSLQNTSSRGASMIYAYEDGAVASFRVAKRLGMRCLYDLPTGHWRAARRLLEKESERWPEWLSTMTGFKDSEAKLARKDEELHLADRIFVASQFTAKTLVEYPGIIAPVEVIPYGFPPTAAPKEYEALSGSRPLRLLFVGKLTQQKGVADLFAVVKALGRHVELTVVGHKPNNDCLALNKALTTCMWIPSLHHEGILKIMREHDILVFPSLFDGFGLVIAEAMSQGTPVIASDRSAGPELISHGHDGWIVEAGSTASLQEVVEEVLKHPELIAEIGQEAMRTANNRSWEVYKRELTAAVLKHFVSLDHKDMV